MWENAKMRGKADGDWAELVERWKAEQGALRRRIVVKELKELPRFVAGADAAFSGDKRTVYAAAVVYDLKERRIIEVAHAKRAEDVPYVPGFLSFREGPAVLEAVRQLRREYGAICFDGQGYAHPRRCGLATHLSVTLDRPGVGVAKSLLVGEYDEPPAKAGSRTALMDHGEQIGAVLRTQDGVRPLFVSVGHRVDLASACRLVLACCTHYRVPEPTRQADIEVARLKKQHEPDARARR